MKLRIEENVLRLRLSEAEVIEFARTGEVACAIAFGADPNQTLRYALLRLPATDEVPAVQLRYAAGALTVEVPAALAHQWADTGRVSLAAQVVVAEGRTLRVLIEKDLGASQ